MTNIEALANELLHSMEILTSDIRGALEMSLQSPLLLQRFATAQRKWKETALRLLDNDADCLRQELSGPAPSQISLFRIADDETGPAKNLDTFSFDFAGPEWAARLDTALVQTVKAASDLQSAIKAAG